MTPCGELWQDRCLGDPTKIRGFQNVSTSRQAVFVTENGDVKIRQLGPRAEAYEAGGKQDAIEEARKIVTAGLTPSRIRELQEKQRGLQRLSAESPKKSRAQISREIDYALVTPSSRKAPSPREQSTDVTWFRFSIPGSPAVTGPVQGSGGVIRYGKEESTRRLRRQSRLAREGKPLDIYEPRAGHVRVLPHYSAGGSGEPHRDVDLRRATFTVVATPGDPRPV